MPTGGGEEEEEEGVVSQMSTLKRWPDTQSPALLLLAPPAVLRTLGRLELAGRLRVQHHRARLAACGCCLRRARRAGAATAVCQVVVVVRLRVRLDGELLLAVVVAVGRHGVESVAAWVCLSLDALVR